MSEILIGRNDTGSVSLDVRYGNRHGLIAGATGTGKSVSLMLLAEGFSKRGVPCFLADAKGDLAGLALPAHPPSDKLKARLSKLKLDAWAPQGNPVLCWDIYGKLGHPIRATVSEMGPTLLGRVLELNDTQQGVLDVVFKVADDEGWLLLDLADLRALLRFATANSKAISASYGLISASSLAAIQRALLKLEGDGAEQFLGEPALELADLMRQDLSGRGVINILAADQVILKPRLYSTFLLWLLSELFEQLPEVGDLEQPKLVFFFDEAHLLFDDAPAALRQRVEQVVRLIRSKGVGVYFCSQNPDDIPGEILGQLGNRVQHALRAFTPRDQKAVKAAAETFVSNPTLDVATAITQLGVGEALASTLREGGVPSPVERIWVSTPCARIGTLSEAERATVRQRSPVGGKYDTAINRASAAERLAERAQSKLTNAAAAAPDPPSKTGGDDAPGSGWGNPVRDALLGTQRREGMLAAMAKSASRTVGSRLGQQIVRGVLGSIFGGKR
ncbi:MAG: helicase HerA-like domain-containing protein [Dyella sp.]